MPIDIEKAMRQQCEAADNLALAYGHHQLAYAARILDNMAKALEKGELPHTPYMTMSRTVITGHLMQYDQWINNFLAGFVKKENKLYEEAVTLLRDKINAIEPNGNSEG